MEQHHGAGAQPEQAGPAREPQEREMPQNPVETTQPEFSEPQEAQSDELDIDAMDDAQLRNELRAALERCAACDTQYNTLLSKVTQMRTTLGDRLRQDAEELDRREQQIDELNAQTDNLRSIVAGLEEKLTSSTEELEQMRTSMAQIPAVDPAETARLEAQCRHLNETVEAQRVDLDRWEKSCMEECMAKERYASEIQRFVALTKEAEEREQQSRVAAAEDRRVAQQLHETLEELQMSQERDTQRTLAEMQQQVEATETELETSRVRLAEMDARCATMGELEERIAVLEREAKEKNLLVEKLRHEAVILNEHLTEALRQIRRDSSDFLVDRRLVTNLFIQFLLVPHADSKRFEILRLIASVLQWSDEDREKAGLQRSQGGISSMLGSLVGRRRAAPNAGDEVRSY